MKYKIVKHIVVAVVESDAPDNALNSENLNALSSLPNWTIGCPIDKIDENKAVITDPTNEKH